MMKKFILISLALSLSMSSVFNRVNTNINTPIVRSGSMGQVVMGGSSAPYLEGANTMWEDDYFLNYQVTDVLQVGITRIHASSTVANMQLIVAKDMVPLMDVAIGVEQISGREKDSTIEGIAEDASNAMSAYVAATSHQWPWEYTLGIGKGRLNPIFFSASYYFSKDTLTSARCSIEYDSNDFNVGLHFPVNGSLALNVALTQLPARTGNNPAYGSNVPFETLSVGVDYSFNLFSSYSAELGRMANKWRDIDEKSVYLKDKLNVMMSNADQSEQILADIKEKKVLIMGELVKALDDAKAQKERFKSDIKSLRELIVSDGFKGVTQLKEELLKDYYQALQYYYDEQYPEAIGELSKANLINNQIPEIHIQMGSIYWTMGQKQAAITAWHRAYDLDKTNEVLNTFLKDHHIDVKLWEAK